MQKDISNIIGRSTNRLVRIQGKAKVIFVGDTHGDVDASQMVIRKYLKNENKIVFLGDYVDRGEKSKENIDYLLSVKTKHPKQVFLLMGNHEAYDIVRFYPADFWLSLDKKLYKFYSSLLIKLPFAATTNNGIIALHGALPNIEKIEEINKIKIGSKEWKSITWGDFIEGETYYDINTGRPKYNKEYFNKIMSNIKKSVLIRSHQADAQLMLYEKRCLTIFTSNAYPLPRRVAVVDLSKKVNTIDEILIDEI